MRMGGLRQLIEELSTLKIGELRKYKQIEAIIDKNPQSTDGRSVVLRAIKILRRPPYGIAILNLQKVGYYRGNLDERSEWVSGRRDHVRRTLVEGYISSAVVDKDELQLASEAQKKRLSIEQSRTGFELMFSLRLEKAKRLPSPERLQPMSSCLGELIEKRRKEKSAKG